MFNPRIIDTAVTIVTLIKFILVIHWLLDWLVQTVTLFTFLYLFFNSELSYVLRFAKRLVWLYYTVTRPLSEYREIEQ